MIPVLVFFASGLVVVLASIALARHADAIAGASPLARMWIGTVLLAGATSLPELTTDVAAVRLGAANLAVGDLFGSSMANMLVLALIDLLPPRRRVLEQAAFDHALAAALAISLNALGGVLVLMRLEPTFLGVGPGPLLLFLGYLAGTRVVVRHAAREGSGASGASPAEAGRSAHGRRRAVAAFVGSAAVVLVAAPAFAWSAKGVAALTGLGDTFVGTALVGLATSMPELVASLAAVRLGAFDLAVGNLFGSNAFNMAIFLPLDLAGSGSLFAEADPSHALSALFAVILMSLGLGAIVYRARRRFAMIEPGSALMLATYLLALWLLFLRASAASG